ncbi:MAG TPA: CPBP family intramembrane glutamic endopeptidase [Gemmataceae bacterium]|jgi:membrane protease YdiL (CAAX protease family)
MKCHAAGLLFALLFPTLSSWAYFELFTGPEGDSESGNRSIQAVYASGKAIQFTFPLFWIWVVERQKVWPSMPTAVGLELGLGFGLLVAGAGLLLYYLMLRDHHLMAQAPEMIREKARRFGTDSPGRYVLVAGFLSFGHSLLEEYYWRWFVLTRLQTRIPYAAAMVVSALAFMAYHVVNLMAFFPGRVWTLVAPMSACIFVGGMVWAWLYRRTGSIYASWVSHLLVDVAVFTVGYDLLFVR